MSSSTENATTAATATTATATENDAPVVINSFLQKMLSKSARTYQRGDFRQMVDNRNMFCRIMRCNDCRSIISTAFDGDALSNAFVYSVVHDFDVFTLLVNNGINVNAKNDLGSCALIEAGKYNKIEVISILVEKKASIDMQDNAGWTALHRAVKENSVDAVQLLLEQNADIELKNNENKTPLDLATDPQIKELLETHVCGSYVLK